MPLAADKVSVSPAVTVAATAGGEPSTRLSQAGLDHHGEGYGAAWSAAASVLELVRVRQWPKNMVVFLPLLVGSSPGIEELAIECLVFALFCISSSLIYVINDFLDVSEDRLHPIKRLRPLASGRLGRGAAFAIASMLAMLGVGLSLYLPLPAVALVLAFVTMNVCYSWQLKRVAIVEVFIVASGFSLRVIAGFCAANLEIPVHLLMFVFFGCLFLSLGKRRNEATHNAAYRAVLHTYNMPFLNAALMVAAANAILFHALYAFGEESTGMGAVSTLLSSVIVTYVVLRYLQIIYVEGRGGDPTETLLKDRAIVLGVVIWLVVRLAALFMHRAAEGSV